MDVCLIDVDSKIPNVALMKFSTYHKNLGDSVKLGYDPLLDRPDLCYASKMFDFTPEPEYIPECEVRRGGPGYSMDAGTGIEDFDAIMPDYSLYQCDYSIGRFTRGCPNGCPWCVVPKMDGHEVRHVADLEDFWGGHECVRLLDDNIMADGDEFCRDCEQLSKARVKVIWDALDIRCVTDETARALHTVKVPKGKSLHFAWDSHAQDDAVPKGIEILKRNGVRPYRLMFYILVGFTDDRDYDMHRIMTVTNMGAYPFVMPFDKSDRYQKDLARWCNNKAVFKTVDFEHYCGSKSS